MSNSMRTIITTLKENFLRDEVTTIELGERIRVAYCETFGVYRSKFLDLFLKHFRNIVRNYQGTTIVTACNFPEYTRERALLVFDKMLEECP